jgi:hypothetical protein
MSVCADEGFAKQSDDHAEAYLEGGGEVVTSGYFHR